MRAITKNGIEASVHAIEDCEPNNGGAWCTIYPYIDEDTTDDYVDDFCIHKKDVENGKVFDEWGGLTLSAEEFATKYVAGLELEIL